MLNDIKVLTELYLHSNGRLPEDTSWYDFHNTLIQKVPQDAIGLLADAYPKDKCKYALFVDVDTINNNCVVKDYIEIDALSDWSSHLFWQGSGGRRSDDKTNSPHMICSKKNDFSVEDFIKPLRTILDDYCQIQEGKGKNKTNKDSGPLFWDKNKINERKWLKNIVDILKKRFVIKEDFSEIVTNLDALWKELINKKYHYCPNVTRINSAG